MGKERRTRQSNREYQKRIRQERYQEEYGENDYFSVIPKSPEEKKRMLQSERRRAEAGYSQDKRRRADAGHSQSKRRRAEAGHSQSKRRRAEAGHSQSKRRRAEAGQSQGKRRRADAERRPVSNAGTKQIFFDYTLVFVVFFLVMFGLLMLYTASIYTSKYFVNQCKFSLMGIVALFVASKIDYHWYATKWRPALIAAGAVFAVLLIWTPLGVSLNGARRWIGIGSITVQPAEIYKIAIILTNAFLITRFNKNMHKPRVLGFFLFVTAFSFLLILVLGQNLSSAIIVAMITVLMVFVACPSYKPFVIAGSLVLVVAGIFIYGCLTIDGFAGFRGERIIAWLQPEKATDSSMVFQSTQALYSIGSGGLGGKGLGNGTQKMILPEAMNDMIFAIICEEMGMVGAFFVLVMFALLLYRLMFIAKNSKDLLGGMIATGVFVHFMVQVVLNIGVVTGLLPPTGVTLPFISYGGTAMVFLMIEIGIALNVSRQIDLDHRVVRRRVPPKQRN